MTVCRVVLFYALALGVLFGLGWAWSGPELGLALVLIVGLVSPIVFLVATPLILRVFLRLEVLRFDRKESLHVKFLQLACAKPGPNPILLRWPIRDSCAIVYWPLLAARPIFVLGGIKPSELSPAAENEFVDALWQESFARSSELRLRSFVGSIWLALFWPLDLVLLGIDFGLDFLMPRERPRLGQLLAPAALRSFEFFVGLKCRIVASQEASDPRQVPRILGVGILPVLRLPASGLHPLWLKLLET